MVKGSSSFRDNILGALRARKSGGVTAGNIREEADRIRREREARSAPLPRATGSDYYSKYRSDDGKIHVFLDRNGNPTTSYPHVHVIHDERGGEVRIVHSSGDGTHPERTTLPGNASGNQINAAVADMLKRL